MSFRIPVGSSGAELNIPLNPYNVEALTFYAVNILQIDPITGPSKKQIVAYFGMNKSPITPVIMTEGDISSSLERLVNKGKLEKYQLADDNEWRYRRTKID